MNQIITITPTNSSIAQPVPLTDEWDLQWLNYFDPYRALEDVYAHIQSLPSSNTPEKHTLRAYSEGIRVFFDWSYRTVFGRELTNDEIIHPMPDKAYIRRFVAYLKATGRSSSTIGSKFLAPLRHYIRALHEQNVPLPSDTTALIYLMQCRDRMRAAEKVKTPPSEKSTNLPSLYAHGNRLTLEQVNATLRQIDRLTLSGLRDYALLMVGFQTGIRAAELQRLTRANFRAEGDFFLMVDLRGKRNQYDPIPVGRAVVSAIDAYITAWNDTLSTTDPRYIKPDMPLWQYVDKQDRRGSIKRYNPQRGIGTSSIANIIAKRTESATGIALAPHDLRRTMTAIAEEAGMKRKDIRRITRHKNVSQLDTYIGDKPDWQSSVLAYHLQIG